MLGFEFNNQFKPLVFNGNLINEQFFYKKFANPKNDCIFVKRMVKNLSL
jgi:hypothetical protein